MWPTTGCSSRDGATCVTRAALGMTKLPEFRGDIPYGEAWVRVEDGINVPPLACSYSNQGLITSLPPGANVFSSLLEGSSEGTGCLFIQAVESVAVHVMPHFGFVDVCCSCLLSKSENLVGYLCFFQGFLSQNRINATHKDKAIMYWTFRKIYLVPNKRNPTEKTRIILSEELHIDVNS